MVDEARQSLKETSVFIIERRESVSHLKHFPHEFPHKYQRVCTLLDLQ